MKIRSGCPTPKRVDDPLLPLLKELRSHNATLASQLEVVIQSDRQELSSLRSWRSDVERRARQQQRQAQLRARQVFITSTGKLFFTVDAIDALHITEATTVSFWRSASGAWLLKVYDAPGRTATGGFQIDPQTFAAFQQALPAITSAPMDMLMKYRSGAKGQRCYQLVPHPQPFKY